MRLPVSLNSVRAFEAAARHLSFTEAARELNMTAGAISYQVRQLEDWLGTPLFNRLPRKLALTDAGRSYYPVLSSLFEQLSAATEELFGEAHSKRPVTLRVTSSLTNRWLVPRLTRFMAAHPEISLRLTTYMETDDVGHVGSDLEIRYGPGTWDAVSGERLFHEALFPVCSPALLDGERPLKTPEQILEHTMIHVVGEPETWQMWLDLVGLSGRTSRQSLQFNLHMMATLAAISGAGVALGLSPMVDDALDEGLLVAPFEQRLPAKDAHFLITGERALERPAVRIFRDWLLGEARAMDQGS